MKVAIINCPKENNLGKRLYSAFCARWIPYRIDKGEPLKEGKHTGVMFFDDKNPELVNKIINYIEDEIRKDLG